NCLKKEGVQLQFIPSEQELIVKTDVHRLSQVLLNLITNSYKFTDKGTITLKYKVQKNKTILFSITDTGIGIPRQQQCKLFERFGKLNHFKQGNGLGLAISRLIVNRLGGEIWIDPNYTEGARFFFTHPL
ncbi:MAG: ATP-binding protein, partial [Bacteroidales bacterium]